jgi:hypothetical protein
LSLAGVELAGALFVARGFVARGFDGCGSAAGELGEFPGTLGIVPEPVATGSAPRSVVGSVPHPLAKNENGRIDNASADTKPLTCS